MFIIEADVPLPAPLLSRVYAGGRALYPFREMKVGESFVAPPPLAARALIAARQYRHRSPGWSYAIHRSSEGVRIWRTE